MEFSDQNIPAEVYRRIDAELDAIEVEHGVRILLAVESGSRAWRFPSKDSDFDVRFIYQSPVEHYLSVDPRRDVIEHIISETLDVSGWDLRKAMCLMTRSNAIALEWLSSPVRYRQGDSLSILEYFARDSVDLAAISHHYYNLARNNFEEILASKQEVRMKTYCYALRPAMALFWIRSKHSAPPMDMWSLMQDLALDSEMRHAVLRLIHRKSHSVEKDFTDRDSLIDAFIGKILSAPVQKSETDRSAVWLQADALFASMVLKRS